MRKRSKWMRSMTIAGFVLALGIATSSGVVAAEKSRAQATHAASPAVQRVAAAMRPETKAQRVAPPAKRSKPSRLQPWQIDPAWSPGIIVEDH